MSNLTRADERELAGLHGQLAKTLRDAIVKVDPETGLPNAALLNVARQFLKDNKIESTAPPKSPMGDLADLPVFEDEQTGHGAAH